MSNKTALQELIEKLESELYELDTKGDISEINDGVRFAYNHILTLIDDGILENEKQQIIKAYHSGQVSIFKLVKQHIPNISFSLTQAEIDKIESGEELSEDAVDYFNSTYGNPQGDPETTK